MATTTNFGWETPDDTDLVKDGALAMRTLGNAIDTSLVDLKGGTTGQVLSKTSNTDMDFTWVTSDDANAIQNAIVDAKGDLITATAADTPARLAVGSNGDTLVADSAATTGLRWQGNFAAGKNKIINGNFGIWQRGTSFTNPVGATYLADRWRRGGVNAEPTATSFTRETFTPGSAPVAGYEAEFFIRSTITTVGSTTTYRALSQPIEDVRTFAEQTVTLSFWAKSDSNRTGSVIISQNFGTGGSTAINLTAQNYSTTTSWTRFSFQFSLPSISGKTIGSNSFVNLQIGQEAASGSVLDIWGVQLEAGSVATAFQTATGTLQGELAACQRYYFRAIPAQSGSPYSVLGTGIANLTADCLIKINLPVQMRVPPTAVDTSAMNTFYLQSGSANSNTPTTLALAGNSSSSVNVGCVNWNKTTSVTDRGVYDLLANGTTAAYVGFSAEL